jgi:capsular exopolysaccharide synthesis family protein
MPEPGAEPSIRGYLHVLRRGRWWVAACTLLGLAIGLTLSLTATKLYSATAQLLLQSTGSIGLTAGAQGSITSAEVQTELQLVNSAQVQTVVRKQLGGNAPGVSAAQVGQTNVIALTAVSPDPALAARTANAYASAFVSWSTATTLSNLATAENQLIGQIRALARELAGLPAGNSPQAAALSAQQAVLKGQLAQLQVAGSTASTGLELVTPALAPASPSSPRPAQEALLGLVAGLIAGIAVAFLRDSLDDTLASGEAVEPISRAPVLATVPMVPLLRKTTSPVLIPVTAPTSATAEAYRSLRTSLQFAGHDRALRTILVTSPGASDGKTTVVVNLGAVFAQAGARVVIVSSDLRRPGFSQSLAPGGHAELCSVLAGEEPLDRAVAPVPGVAGLWALGARTVLQNPTELLASQQMRTVLADLAKQYDLVLIDSPPVLPVADAMILSSYADGVLLVLASGQTRRGELRRTTEKLAQAGAPVVGCVLNKASAQQGYSYYGGYRPYGVPGNTTPSNDSAGNGAAWTERGKQNGAPLPSGQPGRREN